MLTDWFVYTEAAGLKNATTKKKGQKKKKMQSEFLIFLQDSEGGIFQTLKHPWRDVRVVSENQM